MARFNVAAHLIPKNAHGKALYHEGLAIPYAALAVSTAIAVSARMDWTSKDLLFNVLFPGTWCEFHPAMVPVIAIGSMMISKRLRLTIDGALGIPAMTVVIFVSCWSFSPLSPEVM